MVDSKVIKNQLKNKNDYSLVKLATKNEATIDEIVAALLSILRNEIAKLKEVNDKNKNKYLFKIVELLGKVSDEETVAIIKDNLLDIRRVCVKRKNNVGKSKVIDKVVGDIDNLLEEIDKRKVETNNSISYKVLNDIIFELKDLDYLKLFLKEYPEKITVKHDDKLYVEELIDQYVLELITEHQDEYLYLENVLKTMVKSGKINITKNETNKIVQRLYAYITEVEGFNISEEQKEKEIYHLNELVNYFDKTKYSKTEIITIICNTLCNLDLSKVTAEEKIEIEDTIEYLSDIVMNDSYNLSDINKINKISSKFGKMNINESVKYNLRRLCNRVVKYLQAIDIPKKMYEYIDYKYDINASNTDAI